MGKSILKSNKGIASSLTVMHTNHVTAVFIVFITVLILKTKNLLKDHYAFMNINDLCI